MFIEKGKKQNTKMVLLVTHFLSMVCYPVDDDYYGRKGNKLGYVFFIIMLLHQM